MTTTRNDGRERDKFMISGHSVTIMMPTQTQMAIMTSIADAASRGSTSNAVKRITQFNTMLASLFPDQADWDLIEQDMLTGAMGDDEYTNLIVKIVNRFYPQEQEPAPRTGPVKRASRTRR